MSAILKAKFALISAVVLWASGFVGIRFAVQDYSPGGLALFRYLIASLFLLSTYFLFKRKTAHRWQDKLSVMSLGILGFAVYNVFLNYGARSVDAGVASFIISSVPVFVPLLVGLIYRERLSFYAKLGFAISVAGVLLIMLSVSTSSLNIGAVFVFIAAFSGAIYTILQKRLIKEFNPIEFTAWAIWGGTLVMLVYTPYLINDLKHASLASTLVVVYMGLFPGVIAYVCWSYGFKHMRVTHAISYAYWLPFFSTFLGFLILGEVPKLYALMGGVIAMVGAIVVSKSKVLVH